MRYPPVGFEPETASAIQNGMPAKAAHAELVDRFATWLATRRTDVPAMIGTFVTGTTYALELTAPLYTPHVKLVFLCSGRGHIDVTCDDDGVTARTQVYAGTGEAGSHSVADALPVEMGPPRATPPAHAANENRSLDITEAPNENQIRMTFAITDLDGSHSLRVYTVKPVFLPHDEDDGVLP